MVKLNVPVASCDLPFRVHGQNLKYVVTFYDGSEYVAYKVCYSICQMFNALKVRLSWDDKIVAVRVYHPNGVGLCCCSRS